ncbi:MAG TPA: Uma2 family endonuclease [Pirellulales bacterium]|nr:Uma2 family endonuclease [Pirellulales bacterium]
MATVTRGELFPRGILHAPALLATGDRLSQAEFHRRYQQYPESIKFELINGTVYMASPQRVPHGRYTSRLASVLSFYEMQTPGVENSVDSTVILGDKSEPRPDLVLRVLPEYGGRTRTADLYVTGPPELVIEVAHSTVAIDLHEKKSDYEHSQVGEYVVVCVEETQVYWFDLVSRRTKKLPADGILRSRMFPGLWIDCPALFAYDTKGLVRTLKKGLASPEHARFVKRLAKAAKTESQRQKRTRKN